MAAKILRSLAVSAFCEDMAMMLAAGIQVDDALSLMRGDSGDGPLYDAASAVLERVQMGEPLAEAVEQCGYFPAYAAQLVAAGEAAGRTESVLKSLAVYYETQDKLEKRLKSAVIYPAVLLFLMAGVLAVLVARVLPVFTGVYTGLAGSVAASSYAYITAANIIGWASLCLDIVLPALLLTGAAAARTQRGNGLFRTLFEKLPFTSAAARRLAEAEGKPLYSVISDPYSYAPLEKSAIKMMQFSALIEGMAQLLEDGMSLPDFYDELLIRTGYVDMLESKDTEENKTRLENVRELKSSINSYVENAETPTLAGFLEEIALYTDLEQYNENDDAVVMMTMHSAKGLEFPHVFLVGFEDGLFPGMRAIGDAEEMEEERRLCYVAITRAKQTLTISHAHQRMIYGRTSASQASRFLREIPESCIVKRRGYHATEERRREPYEKRITCTSG